MGTLEPLVIAPAADYRLAGQRWTVGMPGFGQALAEAHARHQRPQCLCGDEGVEMYIARLGPRTATAQAANAHGPAAHFIVKRMPQTGPQHAPECPSYEPQADLSGLGQVLGSAITEDPETGETTLKLDFPLSRRPGRPIAPPTPGPGNSAASDGMRLSLRGLLHYLWDQAELTRWQPAFLGKRSWGTVRGHLLRAAENKLARGGPLMARLYIPEVFSVEQRDAINARRRAAWAAALGQGRPAGQDPDGGKAAKEATEQLLLVIAEVKEILPARYGFKAVLKHVPDQGFAIDETLYRRLGRAFDKELALWGASEHLHMVMIATVSINAAGLPSIAALSLMPVTAQWLPVENSSELALVDHLVREARSFTKGLRYNLAPGDPLVSAVLTDLSAAGLPLFIAEQQSDPTTSRPDRRNLLTDREEPLAWVWDPADGEMPALPKATRRTSDSRRS